MKYAIIMEHRGNMYLTGFTNTPLDEDYRHTVELKEISILFTELSKDDKLIIKSWKNEQ